FEWWSRVHPSLKDGQRRGIGYMMGDQVADHLLHGLAFHVQAGERLVAVGLGRANVRRLAGNKLRVYQKAVLEIIDAERGGLAKADRAEVARHLQPAVVRVLDDGRKLSAGDVHVGLERGDALF